MSYHQPASRTQQQIVDMFMDLRKRLDDGSSNFLCKILPFDEDRQSLIQQDSLVLLQYIKQVVIFLVKSKIELEQQTPQPKDQQNEYEGLVQKLEADIRQHIRVEQQLRLYAESTQSKYEDVHLEKRLLLTKIHHLEQKLLESENYDVKQRTEGCETLQRYKIERPNSSHKLQDLTNKSKVITEPMEIKKLIQNQADIENKIGNFGIKKKNNLSEYKPNLHHQHRISQPQPSLDVSLVQSKQIVQPVSSYNNSPLAKKASIEKYRNSTKLDNNYVKQQQPLISQLNNHSQQQLGYRSYSQEQAALGYRLNFAQQLQQQ